MKQRWIAGALITAMLCLAACAPRQGAGTSSAAPPSVSAAESPEPTPYDYDY